MKNDDKLREQLSSEPVPERLKPEKIKIMLDKEAPGKKRSRISAASRITAAAAACAVIGGTAVYNVNNGKINKENGTVTDTTGNTAPSDPGTQEMLTAQKSYMSGADDYTQIYTIFEKSYKKAEKERRRESAMLDNEKSDVVFEAEITADAATGGSGFEFSATDNDIETPIIDAEISEETENSTEDDHYDTYSQESGVLESDIVKTDGKCIYYLSDITNEDYTTFPVLRVAETDNGTFTESSSINLKDYIDVPENGNNISAVDMYIYNDMLAVELSCFIPRSYDEEYYKWYSNTYQSYILFFTTGASPEYIDSYIQDGYSGETRITPDGYMLVTTSYSTESMTEIESPQETEKYIPKCGLEENYDLIAPEDILLPNEDCGNYYNFPYEVISSINLNNSGAPEVCDVKTMAGYSGSIYCTADNLYTAANAENNTTAINRISINNGILTPEAGCSVEGFVKDQFSMSEYNGYFRVAATYSETKETFHAFSEDENIFAELRDLITGSESGYYTYEHIKTDTRVYVLDMDMNIVGRIGDLGVDEQLKSASFSGDKAYIVTFRQTDPLYAVDLSDPANPTVLDEFKINGYSSYLQSWGEGLLLGFGEDADDSGVRTGIKITMFDNSDPNNLRAVDTFSWNNSPFYDETVDMYEYSSIALSERKALLINPEKNIIGIPLYYSIYSLSNEFSSSKYVFLSFEDGKFTVKGEISNAFDYRTNGWINHTFSRAIYIGDYIYALSDNKFISADMDNIEIIDELNF